MRNVTEWVFWSKRHLGLAVVSTCTIAALLFVVIVTAKGGLDAPAPAASPSATPTVRRSDLVPPTTPITASPTPSYGSPAPIALEVTEAFLKGDLERFSGVATAAMVEGLGPADLGNGTGRITGDVQTIEPGPTQQTLAVPTSTGTLQMIMLIEDGAWKVSSLRYAR